MKLLSKKLRNIVKKKCKKNLKKLRRYKFFFKSFIKQEKKTDLIPPMQYGLLPGGKKLDQKF